MPMNREDEVLAEAAIDALLAEAELTPKPGLPDRREADFGALRWSARSLAPGLAAMAAAARRSGGGTPGHPGRTAGDTPPRELRRELGAIGRHTERTMARANTGTALHHGAVWPLGLLVAAAALEPATAPDQLPAAARRLAALPDPSAPRVPSPGATVASRYGAAGARGEARAGFPHIRRALTALGTARSAGAREPEARLDALLTIMCTLQDTGLLHAAGPHGLRQVQNGAHAVLEAGGAGSDAGGRALRDLDSTLRADGLRPRGSAHLLAGALFLDILRDRTYATTALPTALAA
ncbi:triphosphoribosyl-dephospho-CoA synthase [Streptomyces paludis]|uniref:triphosphoribosyl-dephospho-CoA synthase n=1 Tax=Streptomyces paludis TaxID=2282738 RepID=A0A345HQX9_9ACTN|nr:triphosphoribosyl-dephospho-CoA synthase [Streptomyces paludis]AXG79103.1 2-(5'-triphosphoribosyl)-3'-dephospho CoA synthase [Streptomyces paludis]